MEPIQSQFNSLQRFQQVREAALARQGGVKQDPRAQLANLIGKKKLEAANLGGTKVSSDLPGASALGAELIGKSLKKAGDLLLYNRETQTTAETPGAKILGNYVDMVG